MNNSWHATNEIKHSVIQATMSLVKSRVWFEAKEATEHVLDAATQNVSRHAVFTGLHEILWKLK